MPRGKNKLANTPKRGKQGGIYTRKRAAQLNSNSASVTGEASSPKATVSQQPLSKRSKKLTTQGLSDTRNVVHSNIQPLSGEVEVCTEPVVCSLGGPDHSINNNASPIQNPGKGGLDQDLDQFDTGFDDPMQVEVHAPDDEFDSDDFASEDEVDGEAIPEQAEEVFLDDACSVATCDSEVNFHTGGRFFCMEQELHDLVQDMVKDTLSNAASSRPKGRRQLVKSLSDTTIYAPALNRGTLANTQGVVNSLLRNNEQPNLAMGDLTINPQVADFVETIWQNTPQKEMRPNLVMEPQVNPSQAGASREEIAQEIDQAEVARTLANDSVLQAEKFKASVAPLPGKSTAVVNDVDDGFFHISCHVSPGLKEKIERGEFIDLEMQNLTKHWVGPRKWNW